MPKGKIDVKGRKRNPVARKNKIGGRKSTKGVAHMSNDELRSTLKSGRGKDRPRAKNELLKRNAPLVIEVAEAA